MSDTQYYNWAEPGAGGTTPREIEEGELSDGVPSSDEDLSPRSLVIDAQEHGSSSAMSSAPPTPPIEMLPHNIDLDTHPIFTTITAPSPPPPTYPTHSSASSSSFDFPPLLPTFVGPLDNSSPHNSLTSLLESEEEVKFVSKVEVAGKDPVPIDILCIYKFRWDQEYIEVLTRQKSAPLIPVKNLYLKAIPGLKQNVLSARISKLGIRSLVLPEPYISTVKKLGLGLNGSSHYVTIPDFVKICTYFKRQAPALVGKFDFVSSEIDPVEVLNLFNDPDTSSSKELLSHLSVEAVKRDLSSGSVGGAMGGGRGTDIFSHRSDGSNPDGSFNLSGVDTRRLTLPNGNHLYLLVKEGVAHLPNPELAKILPAVSRTAMEHIRNSYGITVEQATKTDMAMLKYLGVVSVKAGRTLLYKARDIVTMFRHWKTSVPEFVSSLAQGHIPDDKVVVSSINYQPSSGAMASSSSSSSSPLSMMLAKRTPSPMRNSPHSYSPLSQSMPRPSPHPSPSMTSHPLHHVNANIKQEPDYSMAGHASSRTGHTPPTSGRASPRTSRPSSANLASYASPSLSHTHFPNEMGPSRTPYSGSPAISRASSREGLDRLGFFAAEKGARKAEFSFSGRGVEQINLASSSSSSLPSCNSDIISRGVASSNSDFSWVGRSSSSSGSEQRGRTNYSGQDFASTLAVEDKISRSSGPSPRSEILMPETFQLPLQMLSSISGGGGSLQSKPSYAMSGSSSLGKGSSGENRLSSRGSQPFPSMSSEGRVRERTKRRGSSSGPLDDQTLEYSVMEWGEESLTLLTPDVGMEGYLAIPELVRKVFKSRSYVSSDIRTRLGVHILPATSLQILTLRSRGSIEITTGNIKLLSLSDAVKLAVAGGMDIPGYIIHLLLKTACSVPLDEILSPKISQDDHAPPPTKRGRLSADVGRKGLTLVPNHPDILPLAPGWKLGELYQMKWGKGSIVVYLNLQNNFCVCLFQIYEALFKRYVTRINFKVRMRKLKIWSNRASSLIRTKLVEVGALPQGCPVCCLITVRQLEQLAKSYGIEPPQVFYEVFLSGENQLEQKQNHQRPQHQQLQNQRGVQQSMSEDPLRSQFTGHTPSPPYGIVPYLTSSQASRSDSPSNSVTSPNLIMTSLGTKATNQSYFPSFSDNNSPSSLIVSIPRQYTPYMVVSSSNISMKPHPHSEVENKQKIPSSLSYTGSRGKVLQTLAKKISQKSKRHAANSLNMMKLSTNQNSANHSRSASSPAVASSADIVGGSRTCPSCGHVNPKHKKRCGICYEFLVGVNCPSCSVLNYYRAKTCFRCGTSMPTGWESVTMTTTSVGPANVAQGHDVVVGSKVTVPTPMAMSQDQVPSSRETSEGATSQPTSPSSPKYSAPPIRSVVLKSLFPQAKKENDSHLKQEGAANSAAKSSSSMGGAGGVVPTRECPECGYLNTRMAKKCVRCKGHLQGRACTRCGRPNLNHVTECYKCGAELPPASSKYVYVGSHSGRAYKTVATTETIETKILLSKAPIICIRCNKIRSSGYLKCGRCGDAFRAQPLATPSWEKGNGNSGLAPPMKKRKESENEGNSDKDKIDPSLLSSLASNILTLGFQEHLTPLFRATEEVSRQQLTSAQEELEAADAVYQSALAKKLEVERLFLDQQASLDASLVQMEALDRTMGELTRREEESERLIKALPIEINSVKAKMQAYDQLMLADY